MKTFFSRMVWLMPGLLCFAACRWAPSPDSSVESQWLKGDTLLIRLNDGAGWRLDIYRDGRGNIRYGRHPNNMLTFERIGFNFDTLRRQLAGSHIKEKRKNLQPARIAYLISETELEHSEILENIELGREIFQLAFEASMNGRGDLRAKRRMIKLFRSYPPFGN